MIEVSGTSAATSCEKAVHRVKARTSCTNCVNVAICKYTEEYMDYKANLESTDFPEIVSIELSCKYFKTAGYNSKAKRPLVPISGKQTSSNAIQIKHTKHAGLPVEDEI